MLNQSTLEEQSYEMNSRIGELDPFFIVKNIVNLLK